MAQLHRRKGAWPGPKMVRQREGSMGEPMAGESGLVLNQPCRGMGHSWPHGRKRVWLIPSLAGWREEGMGRSCGEKRM